VVQKVPPEALLYADYMGTIRPLVALYSYVSTEVRSEWGISLWSCQNWLSAAWWVKSRERKRRVTPTDNISGVSEVLNMVACGDV